MFVYHVRQGSDGLERILLQDNAGQLYLARTLGAPPPLGARLDGARPHLGFGILVCKVSGQAHRVIFEAMGGPAAVMPSVPWRAGAAAIGPP